jgi:hypothetical protein
MLDTWDRWYFLRSIWIVLTVFLIFNRLFYIFWTRLRLFWTVRWWWALAPLCLPPRQWPRLLLSGLFLLRWCGLALRVLRRPRLPQPKWLLSGLLLGPPRPVVDRRRGAGPGLARRSRCVPRQRRHQFLCPRGRLRPCRRVRLRPPPFLWLRRLPPRKGWLSRPLPPTRRGWLLLRLLVRLFGPRRRQPLNPGTGHVSRTSTLISFDMSSLVKYIMIFMTRCGNNVWARKIECPWCGVSKHRRSNF